MMRISFRVPPNCAINETPREFGSYPIHVCMPLCGRKLIESLERPRIFTGESLLSSSFNWPFPNPRYWWKGINSSCVIHNDAFFVGQLVVRSSKTTQFPGSEFPINVRKLLWGFWSNHQKILILTSMPEKSTEIRVLYMPASNRINSS